MWHNVWIRAADLLVRGRGFQETVRDLSKDDLIDVQGTVVAVHSGGLYRVPVSTRGTFSAGTPERLMASGFRPGDNMRSYAPAPDGQRFVSLPGWEVSPDMAQVNFALHWSQEVRRKLGLTP